MAVERKDYLRTETQRITRHEEAVGVRGSVNREVNRLGCGRDGFVQGRARMVVHRYLRRDATDRTEVTNEAIHCGPGGRHVGCHRKGSLSQGTTGGLSRWCEKQHPAPTDSASSTQCEGRQARSTNPI